MRHLAIVAGLVLAALPADAFAQARGGTLRTVYLEPTHLNPAIVSGTPTGIPGVQLFAGLVQHDEHFQPQPYLAERWEISPDGKTYTFHLVEGATFHDGKPVTSEDVKFSAEVVKANHPFGPAMHRAVERIETPDPRTVVFRLKHPYPAFMAAMAPILLPVLPKHVYGTGDIKANPANTRPVGSGPFRFAEWERGRYIILQRYDKFFRPGRPYLDRIIIEFIPDAATRAAAVERGDIHVVTYNYVSLPDAKRLDALPHIDLVTTGYEALGPLNWLAFNLKRPELANVKVRRAIAHLIDKPFVVREVLQGFGKPATGPIHSASPFYNPNVPKYPYSVETAGRLLDEAGYKRGADGIRFKVTIDGIPGAPELQQGVSEYLRQQLRQVGIDASVRNSPDFPTWANRVSNYDFDLTMDIVFNWPDPVIGVERTYISSNIKKGVIWTNTQSYSNPEVDRLFDEAQRENDLSKRKRLYGKAQEVIATELPIVHVNEIGYFSLINNEFGGFPGAVWGVLNPLDAVYWKKAK
jgi:peptide/nickel transport system substrate-binding protein